MKLNDKTDLRILRHNLTAALKDIDPSLTFKVGNIRYDIDGRQATIKLEVASNDAGGFRDEAREALQYSSFEYGQTFTNWEGQTFKIVGYKPRSRKYPVIAERVSDGKKFKFTRSAVTNG